MTINKKCEYKIKIDIYTGTLHNWLEICFVFSISLIYYKNVNTNIVHYLFILTEKGITCDSILSFVFHNNFVILQLCFFSTISFFL